jgi:hypothetical protein
MMFPAHFAASSAGRSDYPSGRGRTSWRRTPFSNKSANSIKLGSCEHSEYAANYDFTNTKSEGTTVQSVHQGEVAAGNGIQVLQDIKVQYGIPGHLEQRMTRTARNGSSRTMLEIAGHPVD